MVASGVLEDLAKGALNTSKSSVLHGITVGGPPKIAPEHRERGPLDKMMKPGNRRLRSFQGNVRGRRSGSGAKKYYLIPYFIAADPGTTDEDMSLHLALWLKKNRYRADQVQTFPAVADGDRHGHVPTPALTRCGACGAEEVRKVEVIKGLRQRRLHKAFLRYHDPDNWPLLREALKDMGRADLTGSRPDQLVPAHQPPGTGKAAGTRRPVRDGGKTRASPPRACRSGSETVRQRSCAAPERGSCHVRKAAHPAG